MRETADVLEPVSDRCTRLLHAITPTHILIGPVKTQLTAGVIIDGDR